jgi:VanZ family protein
MLRRASLWLPPVLYAVAIFHFSSQSEPLPELTAHVWDKVLHTVEYTGLGLLVFRAVAGEGLNGWTATLLTIVIVSLYGASDEWHQSFVPLRTADVYDWLVDTMAAALGAAAYTFVIAPRFGPRRRRAL